jgi:hypothetical protein
MQAGADYKIAKKIVFREFAQRRKIQGHLGLSN